ncbi:DUF3667 domain-containing protein [Tenacibaculum sp. IB213877]|uniref:DUF3667 domain-containing protein n=1 Tax=Tenacibaculum sp. IB213877 TaxID=3097351 RepID=UPI002A59CF35|nr:DUF3667 domain-containing protein [Tenacibaculum sp. IB213877]MDY0781586.1 DUF3667 domain-containing protein [Tenacibaculum sp. IB213877]
MSKKNKPITFHNLTCLNCGYPFFGHELYCPNCGQKNKTEKLTFTSFTKEVFNGFTSWDAKFWKTLFPLLTKPGKVSKDYIEGKRARYVNPFRFYITISIVFFLIIGLLNSYTAFKNLSNGDSSSRSSTSFTINENGIETSKHNFDYDSFQNQFYNELEKNKNKKDSLNILVKNNILTKKEKDSILSNDKSNFSFSFGDSDKMQSFMLFQKKHPHMNIDKALDSLGYEKTFSNRFWYSRSGFANSMISTEDANQKYINQIISYTSIALFILLPIFTLFLFLIYVRKKFSYVEHLVFVFHIQTVFFLLFTFFIIINFFIATPNIIILFIILFLVYLFVAMKNFYNQGYFKTFLKYTLANIIYLTLSLFGMLAMSLIAFALY